MNQHVFTYIGTMVAFWFNFLFIRFIVGTVIKPQWYQKFNEQEKTDAIVSLNANVHHIVAFYCSSVTLWQLGDFPLALLV